MITLPFLTTSLYTFHFKRLGEFTFEHGSERVKERIFSLFYRLLKAGLHVRHQHKHKPRVNPGRRKRKKKERTLVLASPRFTRGLFLCLCLCLRFTCN